MCVSPKNTSRCELPCAQTSIGEAHTLAPTNAMTSRRNATKCSTPAAERFLPVIRALPRERTGRALAHHRIVLHLTEFRVAGALARGLDRPDVIMAEADDQ
jgi:hypothetical protein